MTEININPDAVKAALGELRDVVRCRCHEGYTRRGLRDPDCECDSADAVETVATAYLALAERIKAANRLAASMVIALANRDATPEEILEAQEALAAYRATEGQSHE